MVEPSVIKPSFWTVPRLALLSSFVAGLAVVLTLGDPGITIDEPLDVRPGRTYVNTLLSRGWNFFRPEIIDAVFRDNAEHPPLGRWLLGIASTIGQPLEMFVMGGPDPLGLYLYAGRLAPAMSFAALVGLIVLAAGRHYGRVAGLAAGFAMLAMPRLFAHAHMGALETFLCLFFTLALLAAARAANRPRPWISLGIAGIAWGLALLVKIHAWFLPPILLVWSVLCLQPRSFKRLAGWLVWGVSGLVVFVVGWPWLWYHSLERISAYWGTGVQRSSIHVQYFGDIYADKDVPWHYPWFYFFVTVPVGLQILGVVGTVAGWRDKQGNAPFSKLLTGTIVFFLALFSTRIPVYDGERLYLLVFPLWAIAIGQGFSVLWKRVETRRWGQSLLALLLLCQGIGVIRTHPFGLSYYNALVGGLQGAERLGLELTYWNDAVDPVLLEGLRKAAHPGATAALAPTLYPGQGVASTTRAMAQVPLILRDEEFVPQADWVVVSRRSAYWKPELKKRLNASQPVLLRTCEGVWLSGIWNFSAHPSPAPKSSAVPPRISESRVSH